MPKNWKYIKKLLEKEFLCERLKGRITYDLTDYRPAPWYQQHFIMKCGERVLLEAVQPCGLWDRRCEKMRTSDPRFCMQPEERAELLSRAHREGIYGVEEIMDAIGVYLHSDISGSLQGQDCFVRALALLDRRCGRRTLVRYAAQECGAMPGWLEKVCRVRLEAEGIRGPAEETDRGGLRQVQGISQ